MKVSLSTSLVTKPIAFSREIASSSGEQIPPTILSDRSDVTSTLATHLSHTIPSCGYAPTAACPRAAGSYADYVPTFHHMTLAATHFALAARQLWPKPEFLPTSSKPLAAGLQILFRFIFANIRSYWLRFSMVMELLPRTSNITLPPPIVLSVLILIHAAAIRAFYIMLYPSVFALYPSHAPLIQDASPAPFSFSLLNPPPFFFLTSIIAF